MPGVDKELDRAPAWRAKWRRAMTYTALNLAHDGPLAILTLNRPERLNALDWTLARELLRAVQAVMSDDEVRAVLLTGAGRGFCAGADLKDVQAANAAGERFDAAALLRDAINPTLLAMVHGGKPVVCAVNGAAAGAGCGLALAADIVLAGRSASFLQAFVRLGVVPDAGSSWLLPRLVGRSRATAMMMLGEKIAAETAADWGLVHAVYDDDALMPAARELALKLATGPTLAYAAIKRMVQASAANDLPHQLEFEAFQQSAAFNTTDFAEGLAAFSEGRTATFSGA
jgi:2-(1,2-epoxy-1,2-dihydrophenyl)acetyl-CoA isomerase